MTEPVNGSHAQANTGRLYRYRASYLQSGLMVDWSAELTDADGAPAQVGGSIRLSRGQTQGIAATLVAHMVTQAIDELRADGAAPIGPSLAA